MVENFIRRGICNYRGKIAFTMRLLAFGYWLFIASLLVVTTMVISREQKNILPSRVTP